MPSHRGRDSKTGQPQLWLVPIVVLLVGSALSRGEPRKVERAAKPKPGSAADEPATSSARENASQPAESPDREPRAPGPDREAAIFKALERDVRLDVIGQPLDAVLEDLARQLDVPLWGDRQTLKDEGVALDQPVTMKIADITGGSALRLLLWPLQLTWVIENDVLMITTSTKAAEKLGTTVYDVTDLVVMREVRAQTRYDFTSLMSVADFSGISEKNKLALGPVIHKALVEIEEEGPPADPGRDHSFGGAEQPSPDQPVFRADHPFVFLIRDNHTGAIVFIGRLVTPGK